MKDLSVSSGAVGLAIPPDYSLPSKPRPRGVWDVEVLTFRLISRDSWVIGFLPLANTP